MNALHLAVAFQRFDVLAEMNHYAFSLVDPAKYVSKLAPNLSFECGGLGCDDGNLKAALLKAGSHFTTARQVKKCVCRRTIRGELPFWQRDPAHVNCGDVLA